MNIINTKGIKLNIPTSSNGVINSKFRTSFTQHALVERLFKDEVIIPNIIVDYPDRDTQSVNIEIKDNMVLLTETEYNKLLNNE